MAAHIFNPSTREVETEGIWLGGERIIKQEETGAQSGDLYRQMQSEVW